jgi:hypothetical protein
MSTAELTMENGTMQIQRVTIYDVCTTVTVYRYALHIILNKERKVYGIHCYCYLGAIVNFELWHPSIPLQC